MKYSPNRIANFEKALNHAKESLKIIPGKKTTEYLGLFKKFLKLEEHRIFLAHRAGQTSLQSVRERSNLIDIIIRQIQMIAEHEYTEQNPNQELENFCILALGGYGREELSMNSDIDIMFLFKSSVTNYIDFMIKRILYMLWDVGLKVGHSSRSISEAVSEGRRDSVSRTAMMEARLINGSSFLFDTFKDIFHKKVIPYQKNKFLNEKWAEILVRWKKSDNTVFLSEPNIKEGAGGLRDWQCILWIYGTLKKASTLEALQIKKIISQKEFKMIQNALEFFFKIRNELHFVNLSHTPNVLTHRAQIQIAYNLGYRDNLKFQASEQLMKRYYLHAYNIHLLCQKLIKTLTQQKTFSVKRKVKNLSAWYRLGTLLYINDVYQIKQNPDSILKALLLATQKNYNLSSQAIHIIKENLSLIDTQFKKNHQNRNYLLQIFQSKTKNATILRTLQYSGFLGKYLPAFNKAHCFVQHDMYHRYTLDEHTMRALEFLDELKDPKDNTLQHLSNVFLQITNKDIIYLAVLYHDLGKVKGKNHSHQGVILAKNNLTKINYPNDKLNRVYLLIEKHLLMSQISQRRNLSDSKTIEDFVNEIQDFENLKCLYCLTYVDMRAVAPGIWNDWRSSLLKKLYTQAEKVLQGKDLNLIIEEKIDYLVQTIQHKMISENSLREHLNTMPHHYIDHFKPEEIIDHLLYIQNIEQTRIEFYWLYRETLKATELNVITFDKEGTFSKIVGVIASKGFNILDAQILSRNDGIIVDQILINTPNLETIIPNKKRKEIENKISEVLLNSSQLHDFIQGIKFQPIKEDVSINITFNNKDSITHTILEIKTLDHPGLLLKITLLLHQMGIDIHYAKISTDKNEAYDTFYIVDYDNQKIVGEKAQDLLSQEIKKVIIHPEKNL